MNKNAFCTEFKVFYQSLLKDISNIPENELRQIKTNFKNTFEKCTKIKIPYKFGRDIAILKADKGRGNVIMNRKEYTEK